MKNYFRFKFYKYFFGFILVSNISTKKTAAASLEGNNDASKKVSITLDKDRKVTSPIADKWL